MNKILILLIFFIIMFNILAFLLLPEKSNEEPIINLAIKEKVNEIVEKTEVWS